MKPSRAMDAMVHGAMGFTGYRAKTLPYYSTHAGAAMQAFNWMANRGIVILTNGDGDSYDCDWLPRPVYADETKFKSAFVRAMYGIYCESFAHAICLALLKGTRKI